MDKKNVSTLRKYYKAKVVEVLRTLTIVFPIGLLIYLDYVIAAVSIALLAIIGIGLYVKDALEARRDMIEFINEMKSGQLGPDMDKSIHAYYSDLISKADALYLWSLNERIILDYEICSDEHDTNFLKIVSADKETGDIETRAFRHLHATLNMKVNEPFIRVLPDGMYLRIPFKTIL